MSAPGAAGRIPPLLGLLSAFGFEKAAALDAIREPTAILVAFAQSDTFRWVRRWAVVGVVLIATPITVLAAYSIEMPEIHHLLVLPAVAVIVPAWVLELSGVRLPRPVLIAATLLPNVWLTLVGHISTNYLWLILLVTWVGFAGTLIEGLVVLVLETATAALVFTLGVSWNVWFEWVPFFLFGWFMGLVLRRQVVVVAELRLLRDKAEQVAVLEERQRLSRELHDSVTQALYGISLYAEAGGRALAEGDVGPAATNLQEIAETTQEALGEMRLLLFELRPAVLQERGLAVALQARLQAVEARSGLVTNFDCVHDERLRPDQEQELYRVAQEALNNVLKHAHAGRVRLRLDVADRCVTLEVSDDGVGFETSLRGSGGFGLHGMQERVARIGGTLRIDSSPGAGTQVHVEVPR